MAFLCYFRSNWQLLERSHLFWQSLFIFSLQMSSIVAFVTQNVKYANPRFGKILLRRQLNEPQISRALYSSDSDYAISLKIETMEDMEEVGALLSVISSPPDSFFLDGDLGAGKTTFSRGFVTCKLGLTDVDDDTEDISVRVTSPTYLLSNTYTYIPEENGHSEGVELPGKSVEDFAPLNLEHVFSNCISLVEWPSRLDPFPQLMPPTRNLLKVNLSIRPSTDERVMRLSTHKESTWNNRLKLLIDEGVLDDLIIDA